MASTPHVHTHGLRKGISRVGPTLCRPHRDRRRASLAVASAERDRRSTRSPSPVAPGKHVSKTVSSKSTSKTVSTKTRVNASATNASTEPEDRQDPNLLRPETDGARSPRKLPNPVAVFAARTDGALVFGDMWIVATTFATSGLLTASDTPPLTAAAISVWCATALMRGDYTASIDDDESAWIHGWSVYTGILYACYTWLFATPVLLLAYALLVSNGVLDAEPVMHVYEGSRVSPALELQVALLILMTAWRGIYYAFKDGVL